MKYEMDIPCEAWGRFNHVGQRAKEWRWDATSFKNTSFCPCPLHLEVLPDNEHGGGERMVSLHANSLWVWHVSAVYLFKISCWDWMRSARVESFASLFWCIYIYIFFPCWLIFMLKPEPECVFRWKVTALGYSTCAPQQLLLTVSPPEKLEHGTNAALIHSKDSLCFYQYNLGLQWPQSKKRELKSIPKGRWHTTLSPIGAALSAVCCSGSRKRTVFSCSFLLLSFSLSFFFFFAKVSSSKSGPCFHLTLSKGLKVKYIWQGAISKRFQLPFSLWPALQMPFYWLLCRPT